MDKITLKDIVEKRFNMTAEIMSPDDLICEAYYKMHDAIATKSDYTNAYIMALVAIEANKRCDVCVPTLERAAEDLLRKSGMTEQEIVEDYLKHE